MPALSSGIPTLINATAKYIIDDSEDVQIIYNSTKDPYEAIIPAFTYAMPVQVVVLGVTITLLSVLFVHLMFTIRYHWPLSRLNYGLQTTAVVVTMAKTAAELHILMNTLQRTGQHWPFTYDYIEVQIPPSTWSTVSTGLWTAMSALTVLVIHMTHIQFLTMLFPSGLEAKLILILLGPLALASAFLSFADLSNIPTVEDLGDAIRNTANSTLTLLYTLAIFIWGLTLNRSRAWRTEGGTATFGIMALCLGVCGTAINFVEVKEERMRWLPGVVSCILLWQSWVGFWWWVGSGMWAGEAEDVERKERKRLKRAEAKRRKRAQKVKEAGGGSSAVGSAAQSFTNSLRRRHENNNHNSTPSQSNNGEEIELTDMRNRPTTSTPATVTPNSNTLHPPRVRTGTTTESVSSGSTPATLPHFLDPLMSLFKPFLARLRVEHDQAAVAKAAEPSALPDDLRRSWGLRALMMRGRKERGERRARQGGGEDSMGPRERQDGFELEGGARLEESEWESDGEASSATGSGSARTTAARPGRPQGRRMDSYPPQANSTQRAGPSRQLEEVEEGVEDYRGRGMDGQKDWWWKGAVARWRLKDVRQY